MLLAPESLIKRDSFAGRASVLHVHGWRRCYKARRCRRSYAAGTVLRSRHRPVPFFSSLFLFNYPTLSYLSRQGHSVPDFLVFIFLFPHPFLSSQLYLLSLSCIAVYTVHVHVHVYITEWEEANVAEYIYRCMAICVQVHVSLYMYFLKFRLRVSWVSVKECFLTSILLAIHL